MRERTVAATPFLRPRPVADPDVRLVVFHHAGGSAAVYHPMVRHLPAQWDLLLMDLPGRGRRFAEPVVEDMSTLVEQTVAALRPWLGAPIALFGHSLGAILATEVAWALECEGLAPCWVGVSARIAPRHQARYRARLHELDDRALLAELESMGGLPDRIREVPEFIERFLPTVRGDLRAVDSFAPTDRRTPLHCRLGVFTGRDDPWAPPELIRAWAAETTGDVRYREFPGDHFYFLRDGLAALTEELVGCVRASRPLTTGCWQMWRNTRPDDE